MGIHESTFDATDCQAIGREFLAYLSAPPLHGLLAYASKQVIQTQMREGLVIAQVSLPILKGEIRGSDILLASHDFAVEAERRAWAELSIRATTALLIDASPDGLERVLNETITDDREGVLLLGPRPTWTSLRAAFGCMNIDEMKSFSKSFDPVE